uniref:Ionotropic receptor 75a-1 n=1 Tax=Anastrepha ludens TaxID=28586 RepID=A0A9E8DAG2_9MUSC|nr:ionotropic receptor 75a-1 [Anastrepha ludens]
MIDCTCTNADYLLRQASLGHYFNKTYQWFLWSYENKNAEEIVPSDINYLGPNSQVTCINGTNSTIWNVYSNGRHLQSPLKFSLISNSVSVPPFTKLPDINIGKLILKAQHARTRNQFGGLKMRAVTVIDLDNITSNTQITGLLSENVKHIGISAFTKYYFELVQILKEHINFSIEFRVARGWAGRLDNTSFRLGFLGIMARNEADVGVSGIFNRISRFAEFDIIHQGWKFETAFLYRFVPELSNNIKAGSFLVPFQRPVWILIAWLIITTSLVFWLIDNIKIRHENQKQLLDNKEQTSLANILLISIAAICQQSVNPTSKWLSIRILFLSVFVFSLLIYNYYTSSVVSGLLSSSAQGPTNIEEIICSPLKVSFEDIGYYKVLFRESKSATVKRLIRQKLLPSRKELDDLPVYTHIQKAISLIKKGSYAFHCELADAFPEIAKNFDANELCTLRVVKGLMDIELMNGIVPKNSQYTEIFRFTLIWFRETGLIGRVLYKRLPKKTNMSSSVYRFSSNFFKCTRPVFFASWWDFIICVNRIVRDLNSCVLYSRVIQFLWFVSILHFCLT